MWTADAGRDAPVGTSPDMLNCMVSKGMLTKRPGTVQYKTGDDAFVDGSSAIEPVLGLFSTQRSDNTTHLIAVTTKSVRRFNTITDVWDKLTGSALNGAGSKLVSFELSQNNVVFANDADKVQLVDLTAGSYADLNTNAPISKYLTRFNGRLILGSTTESAVAKPYRLRWSVRDDHTDWTGAGSGFRDQPEFPAHLRNIRKIANGLAVYYEKAIEMAVANPDATAPFVFDTRVTEEGLYAPFSVAGRNDRHFILGVGNFYEFNGSQINEIFSQVRETIYNSLSATNLARDFSVVSYDTQEYLAFVSTGAALNPDTVWVWNWQRGIAYPWSVDGFRCSTIHRLDDALTIDELVGTIDEQNYEYDSQTTLQAFPTIMLGGDDGKVYRLTNTVNSDSGDAIPCRWSSHDFTAEKVFQKPGHQVALERVTVEYQGVGQVLVLDFYVSVDGGDTWTGPFTESGSGSAGLCTLTWTRRQAGDRVRFKIQHNTADSSFRISRFDVELELLETKASIG